MDKLLINDFKKIVGNENVAESPEELMTYAYDSSMRTSPPELAVFPQNTGQVAAVVKLACLKGIPISPRGAGTGSSGGSVPDEGGIALVLTDMDKILEINKENLYAVVEPGVITGKLQQEVERLGLFYPPDPGSLNSCTIGGNIAVNSGGPRAFKYGVTRDYILGLEVVIANGEVLNTGGKTVKNVSGYDLTRLMVGAEGTLGVITKAIIKLVPKPKAIRTALVIFDTIDQASRTVVEVISNGIKPTTMELMDDVTIGCVEKATRIGLPLDAGAILLIEVDGSPAQVDEEMETIAGVCRKMQAQKVTVAQSAEEREKLWQARRAVGSATALRPTKVIEDATVPCNKVPEMVKRLKAIARKNDLTMAIFGHAGDGNLHSVIMTDQRNQEEMARAGKASEEIFAAAIELEGTLSGEHGIGSIKAPYLSWKVGETGIKVMREIKGAIDPDNIFNRNKVLWG
jgi:glycolate oxidase